MKKKTLKEKIIDDIQSVAHQKSKKLNLQKIITETKNSKIIIDRIYIDPNYEIDNIVNIIHTSNDSKIRNSIIKIKKPSLNSLFENHNFKKYPINLLELDVKNNKSFHALFKGSKITKDLQIYNWITKNVNNMEYTFAEINNLHFNLSQWDLKKVESTHKCFITSNNNNTNMNNWEFENLETTNEMFAYTDINFNFNTWKFNIPHTYRIRCYEMFAKCPKQTNTFQTWDFNKIDTDDNIFLNCKNIFPNSKNFYTVKNYNYLKNLMNYHNIIYQFKKYKQYIHTKTLKQMLWYYLEIQNKKTKYYKEYKQFYKTL